MFKTLLLQLYKKTAGFIKYFFGGHVWLSSILRLLFQTLRWCNCWVTIEFLRASIPRRVKKHQTTFQRHRSGGSQEKAGSRSFYTNAQLPQCSSCVFTIFRMVCRNSGTTLGKFYDQTKSYLYPN